MILRLLNEVVASAGVEIRTSGDCHTLSEVITVRTGKVVNYNTLRRVRACQPVKPSRGSWTSQRVCGVRQLFALHKRFAASALHPDQGGGVPALCGGQDAEAIALLREMPESTLRSDMVIQMGRELFVSGDTARRSRSLSSWSRSSPIAYSEIVHVGNSMGIARHLAVRLRPHQPPRLPTHGPFLVRGYPHLSGYYGAEVDALEPGRAHSPEFELFTRCWACCTFCWASVEGNSRGASHAELSSHPAGTALCMSHDDGCT